MWGQIALGTWRRESNIYALTDRCDAYLSYLHAFRLERCYARSTKNCADWGHIVFTDESCFHLCSDDNHRRVFRHPGWWGRESALNIACLTGPQQDVMIWDAISLDIWSPLVVISCVLIAQRMLTSFYPQLCHCSFCDTLDVFYNTFILGCTCNALLWIVFNLALYIYSQPSLLISLT